MMELTSKKISKILLSYNNSVALTKSSDEKLPLIFITSLLQSLSQLGYTLSSDLISGLEYYSKSDITVLYKNLIGNLKEMTGADKNWQPMYPNFPDQVMEASDAELYINAAMHYVGAVFGMRIMPEYKKNERFPLTDFNKLKILNVATEKTFHTIFKNLMSSPTSVSEQDMKNIEWYISTYRQNSQFPESIPHKEMLASIVNICIKSKVGLDVISNCASTSTDVLRIAVAMSGGDVSLSEKTIFFKFNRKNRRFLLNCLENVGSNMIDDMAMYVEQWKRLGEILHPSEYSARFPKAAKSFKDIRNGNITTFNSLVESYLEEGDVIQVVKLMKNRSGVFARRLDHVLRISDEKEQKYVVSEFSSVANKVSTPVLLQVSAHFKYRDSGRTRIVFPKGSTAKAKTLDKKLPYISNTVCADIVRVCERALKGIYSSKVDMGKVYIDSCLKNYFVPFSQRSASNSLRTITRGSRIDLDGDKSSLRFFIWWKGIDVDLSSILYDEDFNQVDQISYTNLINENGEKYACHSGDITSAPNGACEFIDVNMDIAIKKGIRYIAMIVHSYSDIPFNEIEECSAGWMERDEVQSGEIFDARTVKNKIDLTSESKSAIPLFVDLKTKQIVWADMSLTSHYIRNNENTSNSVLALAESIVNMKRHNLWDLFIMHVEARNGTLVDDMEDADQIFSVEHGVTPFDFDKISADYI